MAAWLLIESPKTDLLREMGRTFLWRLPIVSAEPTELELEGLGRVACWLLDEERLEACQTLQVAQTVAKHASHASYEEVLEQMIDHGLPIRVQPGLRAAEG